MEFKTPEELKQFVQQFVLKVTEKSSDPRSWSKSKTEWEISYYGINEANHHLTCYLCGNPLHHVLGLYNEHTTRNLYPVCPFCIDKFEEPEMKEEVSLLMSMYAFHLISRDA